EGKKDERVANDVVTLVDDGQLLDGLMTFKTDTEGVPSQTTTLIERGFLKSYLYDSYSAFQEERSSTGNAEREWPEPFLYVPSVSTSNLVLKPGTKSLYNLVEEVDEGILITDFVMGVGHSNRITGEFSVVAPNAFFVKNGEIKYPLESVTVAGNFFNSLKKMREIGSDPKTTSVGKIPSLIIEDLTVSG
nr:TldD/PmbA family protein [Candidatus Korarchaeota archaeon]